MSNKSLIIKISIWVGIIAGICTILGISVSGIISKVKSKRDEKPRITTELTQNNNKMLSSEQLTSTNTSENELEYGYQYVWEFDEEWSDYKCQTSDTCILYAKRTLYHGQRKYTEEQITYKHKRVNEDGTEDIVWTGSKVSPKGYEYEYESLTKKIIKYENLGKWVTNEARLGEYSYNVVLREQYKYRRKVRKKIIIDTISTSEKDSL